MSVKMQVLPLSGAGFENLGQHGRLVLWPMPHYGTNELLCRHDAVGLCGSDYAVIRAGQDHANVHHDLSTTPVVLGHEVAMTVVGVGENLAARYQVGDRFVIQPDIQVAGVRKAFGYEIPGGLSQYGVLDRRVLNGNGAGYLLPLAPSTGYAEAALTEPWACVGAAYCTDYRTAWKEGGVVLVTGEGRVTGWEDWSPAKVFLSDVSPPFETELRNWAARRGVELREEDGEGLFDDILVLSSDAASIESALSRLRTGGIMCVVTDEPVTRSVGLDVGRVHYDGITLVGTPVEGIDNAYRKIRSTLHEDGAMWALGASGPSGWMHAVRALEVGPRPRLIAATNLRSPRLDQVVDRLRSSPGAKGVEIVGLTEEELGTEAFHEKLWELTGGRGFDDIVALAPSAKAIGRAVDLLARDGVLNVYAGISRGSIAEVDLNAVVRRGVRFIGSSGSSIDDMRRVLELTESGAISTNQRY